MSITCENESMRAWQVVAPGPVEGGPVTLTNVPAPEPGDGEIGIRVLACGVCRTDLHVVEGDLAPRRKHVIPGHEVVGMVETLGEGVTRFSVGDRVGIAWLRHTCGTCRWCVRGEENLCVSPRFTGWDDDGGYAEHAVVDQQYAYPIPEAFSTQEAAPLLCAGIIGYRALRRAELPEGGRLGIYGFGGSAHLTAQVAIYEGATVHVMTRSEAARELAMSLGCASTAGAYDKPPEKLDSAILFAPVGDLVPVALRALDRGGTLAIAGIHMTDIPRMEYQWLFEERQIRSVTANTRQDGNELLDVAARIPIRPTITPYPLEEAHRALQDLAEDRVNGAAVLVVAE
jgi:propanol-preferring alcohol dehydrogenase